MIFDYGSPSSTMKIEESKFCDDHPIACLFAILMEKSYHNPFILALLSACPVLSIIAYIVNRRHLGLKNMYQTLKRNYMSMQFMVVEVKARRRAYLMLRGVLDYHDHLKRSEEAEKSSTQEKKVASVVPSKKKPVAQQQSSKKTTTAASNQSQSQKKKMATAVPPPQPPSPPPTTSNGKNRRILPPKLKVCPSKSLQWKYVQRKKYD